MDEKSSQMVSLTDEAAVKQILVDSVFGLWKIVNNLTRVQPSKHERYRVTIFVQHASRQILLLMMK
ncbi:hypothetical protein L0244_04570 [bacterium]|nr:hypothetical protein [bacterium]